MSEAHSVSEDNEHCKEPSEWKGPLLKGQFTPKLEIHTCSVIYQCRIVKCEWPSHEEEARAPESVRH